jgi:hypothetical protein
MPSIVKKTIALIVETNCDFLVQVKRNCSKLWETLALYCALHHPISTFEYYEQSRGGIVFRNVQVYNTPYYLPTGWKYIERVIKVRRWGYKNNTKFEETSYYISSNPINFAQKFADAIQGHWSIENNLHWTKDVIMGEDDMSYKSKNAIAVIGYMNNLLLNIIVANGEKPNKDFFAKYANKPERMIRLFRSKDDKT